MFGANNNKPNMFNVPTTQTNAFGTGTFGAKTGTTAFGSMGQQQQTNLFGSTTSTGFGTANTTSNIFGQQPSSIFGGTTTAQQQTSVFGAPAATTGFGTSNSLFSGNSTMNNSTPFFGGSQFGSNTTTPFGPTSTSTLNTLQPVTGTTVKFNPILSTDTMVKNGTNQNINTRHLCITSMKEYESKSLEELRYEDYQANRKGNSASTSIFGTPSGQGIFNTNPSTSVPFNSANTTGSSLFNTTRPGFSAPTTTTTSIFNSSTFNMPFNSNTSGFSLGANQQTQPTQPAQTTSIFGITPAATTGFQTQNSLFSMSAPQSTTTTAVKPFFTATTSQPSLFSNTATTNNTLGNKGLFSTGTSAFTAPTSNTGFAFNPTAISSTATTGSNLFSNNQSTSLFNTSVPSTQNKSMFNFPSQTTGLTQTNTLNPTASTGTSLFNTGGLGTGLGTTSLFNTNPTNTGSSIFGINNATNNTLVGSGAQNQSGMLSFQQISRPTTINSNDLLLNRLQSLPYGSSPLFQNKIGSSPGANLKFTTDPKTLNQYKVSYNASANNSKLQRTPNLVTKNTSLLFDGLDDDNPEEKKTSLDIFVPRKNIKKLVIKPKDSNSFTDSITTNEQAQNSDQQSLRIPIVSKHNANETTTLGETTVMEYFRQQPKGIASTPAVTTVSPKSNEVVSITPKNKTTNNTIESPNVTLNDSQNYSILGQEQCDSPVASSQSTFIVLKCNVILHKPEYYTIPALDCLDHFYDEESRTCIVDNFTVGRHGYGSIYWEGPLDIYGLNLDELVHVRRKEVIVYPDDENKAPQGTGLNRPAQITLHKVWPVDKTTHEIIKDADRLVKMNYAEKIENATIKFGGIFKEYRPDTGSWVFNVKHFSKYGLLDDEEEEPEKNDKLSKTVENPYMYNDKKIEDQIYYNKQDEFDFAKNKAFNKFEIDEFNQNSYNYNNYTSEQNENFNKQNNYPIYGQNLFNYEDEVEEESINSLPLKNDYYSSLRNAFFENEEVSTQQANLFKKSKKLLSVEKQDQEERRVDVFNNYPIIQPKLIQKRELFLEPDDFPTKNKIIYDLSSIKCGSSPKVRFFNGSNNFLLINKRFVNIMQLKLTPNFTHTNIQNRFHLQLTQNSEISSSLNKCPYIQVKSTISNIYNSEHLEKLVKALYGFLETVDEYEHTLDRTNHIIDWLCEQNRLIKKPDDLYKKIVYYLASNDVLQASEIALKAKHPKLALLLVSGVNFNMKSNLDQQLANWRQSQSDMFISRGLLRIYAMLSGNISIRLSNNEEINVLDDLTWTQQLSCLLLYSIKDDLVSCINNMTCKTNDVEYHLIANHSPLEAMSASSNDLDSWFLHQTLKSYGIIDEEINSNVIHGLLANHLIAFNVKWSCFVALHINNDLLREYTIKELLLHYVIKLTKDDEDWLKKYLLIPQHYISNAKAIYCKLIGDMAGYASHLLECEDWVKAHNILIDHIFPELVINEEHEKLRQLINKLKPYKESIANWYTSGAHIFDIYCQCVEDDEFDEDLMSEPFNFHHLKCNNKRQILCQSEIARKINLIHNQFTGNKFILNTPIPSDYALNELKYNCHQLLKEIAQN